MDEVFHKQISKSPQNDCFILCELWWLISLWSDNVGIYKDKASSGNI